MTLYQAPLMPYVLPEYITDEFGYWFAGITDGEAHFEIRISESAERKYVRRDIDLRFRIKLRDDDRNVLTYIRDNLRCGTVYDIIKDYGRDGMHRRPQSQFSISKNSELLSVLIPVFNKYPLRTKKGREFVLWSEAVYIHSISVGHRRMRTVRNRTFLTDGQWNRLISIQNEIRNNIREYQGRSE